MKKLNIVLVILLGMLMTNCSTYSIKPDQSKNGVVNKTPKWYVDYKRTTWTTYQESASSVSPDMDLAVKKSILLAKAKLADRISGEMNNRSTITKNEAGTNENLKMEAHSQDLIVNVISKTILDNYKVIEQEIYSTKNKSYRSYVMIEVKKKDIEAIKSRISSTSTSKISVEEIERSAKELIGKKG